MHVKKTITLPQELEIEVEDRLIGTYYASLSDVIRDGLRKILAEYKRKNEIEIAISLYKEEKITLREAAAIMGVPLRKALEDLSERGVYLRYGLEELEDDLG
jgi:predicted HTH domain antitoxin